MSRGRSLVLGWRRSVSESETRPRQGLLCHRVVVLMDRCGRSHGPAKTRQWASLLWGPMRSGFVQCQFKTADYSLVVRRGFVCVVECCLCSFDFGEDWLGGFGPAEGFGVVVPVGGPVFYGVVELGDGGEGPSFEGFAGEYGEPGLDEVGPACAGGGEVEVPAFAAGLYRNQCPLRSPAWCQTRLKSSSLQAMRQQDGFQR